MQKWAKNNDYCGFPLNGGKKKKHKPMLYPSIIYQSDKPITINADVLR